jgi:hypothetical protein
MIIYIERAYMEKLERQMKDHLLPLPEPFFGIPEVDDDEEDCFIKVELKRVEE